MSVDNCLYMKILDKANVRNKRVLVRCDFNCPLDGKGNILDDYDIERTIPTIEYLVKKEAKVILISHLDRPEGKVVENLRLTPIQERLFEYLDLSILKAPDCRGEDVKKMTKGMMSGEILLLENLRFHKEEEENDGSFAKELASLGDIFVNEAFGVCHRAHASVVGIPNYLPSYAGFLLEEEVKTLSYILGKSKKPLVAVFGGVKASTKVPAIEKFLNIADFILVGGKIASEIKVSNPKLLLPEDYNQGLDIGERTIKKFKTIIQEAATVVWNGPMGYFEKEEFKKGTKEIAIEIAKSKAFKVAGGGETSLAISKYNLKDKFNFISVGGGAMLEFLAGKKLPGLAALSFYH